MSQRMQFEEEPDARGNEAPLQPGTRSEGGSSPTSVWKRGSKERFKPLSQSYPRALRLLGLLLIVLGVLLGLGIFLSTQFSLITLYAMIAVVADVLFFLGFWLLFKKSKIPPAPHD